MAGKEQHNHSFVFRERGYFLLSASAALLTSLFVVFLVYNNITTILQADIYKRQDCEGGEASNSKFAKNQEEKPNEFYFVSLFWESRKLTDPSNENDVCGRARRIQIRLVIQATFRSELIPF